jgi:hypothetical protein
MDAYFVCLANSLKRGGRCIAGVEVTIDDAKNWTVVRKADGSPKWIRPIDETTEFGEIRIGEAQFIPLLSVVRLKSIVPIPNQAHTEDVHYTMMQVVGKVKASDEVLQQFVDNIHQVVFYGTDRAIDIPTYAAGDHSLMSVRADEAEIVADVREDKTRYRMLMGYRGVTYDLSVTDPYYIELLNEKRVNIGKQPDVYVTLSLGLVYEERHHKLIAAVITPSSNGDQSTTNKVLDEKQDVHEVSVIQLTKTERRTIKNAFVVPSQNGYALCFRRKDGGEDFLPIDEGSNVQAWQLIAPKSIHIVTYSDNRKFVRICSQNEGFLKWILKIFRIPKIS